MAKYRILSLDGGGLRGLITARMLDRLTSDASLQGWLDEADLIAGTSTGGILALGLASGKAPKDICDMYVEEGPKIFDDSLWDNITDLGKTIGADYSTDNLKAALKGLFGTKTLSSLKTRVTIPTFDLDNEDKNPKKRTWKPKIFHNFPGADSDGGESIVDVALYTTAAPTFFPSVDGYIDGGVFANNPSMIALAQAISTSNKKNERAGVDDIVMLSIGTGASLSYITGQTLDWGLAQWAKPLINVLTEGVAGISDYQSRQLLGDRYHRLQVTFDPSENIALDDVDKIPRMDQIGQDADLDDVIEWIRDVWLPA
jgi:patatin-like phospholipase/acyl hydrolase